MSERVLVTGGAGFIGSRLVARLLGHGVAVTVLDALLPSIHGADASPPSSVESARFIRGDVRDEDAWRDALDGVGTVYHLAAETGTGESMYRARHYVDVNVGGTALLCDLLLADAAPSVRRVVLASSRAVYGEGPYRCDDHGVVYPEPRSASRLRAGRWEPACPRCGADVRPVAVHAGIRTGPTSTYGMTKRDQEELLRLLLPPRGVDVVSLRLQNVYGPGQSLQNPYTGILSIFSVRLLDGQPIRVFEDGLESRDFVYVDDVVDAFLAASEAPGSWTSGPGWPPPSTTWPCGWPGATPRIPGRSRSAGSSGWATSATRWPTARPWIACWRCLTRRPWMRDWTPWPSGSA